MSEKPKDSSDPTRIPAETINLIENGRRVVPVIRESSFQRYSPNSISTWGSLPSNGPFFRIILQNIEQNEVAHLALQYGEEDPHPLIKRTQLEVRELGEVILGESQARQLHQDLTNLLAQYAGGK